MTNPTNLKSNHGQGLIETVLILPIAIALTSLIFFACYRALLYFYADYALHEAMICTDANSNSYCSRSFEQQVSKISLKNEMVRIDLSTIGFGRQQKLKGKITLSPKGLETRWHYPILISKTMSFPLRSKN